MRKKFQNYLNQTAHLDNTEERQKIYEQLGASLQQQNTVSNSYQAPSTDPFRLDDGKLDHICNSNQVLVYREIASMPFGPNDTRLPVVLQMHWFSHCSSCFKNSRATSGAHICRYLFPRDRVSTPSIGASAIQLVRLLGHEYINGYSEVVLRAFKCNHDIQVSS